MKTPSPFIALIGSIFLSCSVHGQVDDVASSHTYTVIINNTCHRDIRVAVHYLDPERGWLTQGWWDVAGRSELPTGLAAGHYQFYMHGAATSSRQWPPQRSRKTYNRYPVLEDSFVIEEGQFAEGAEMKPFSLKEVTPGSAGLKARFDC